MARKGALHSAHTHTLKCSLSLWLFQNPWPTFFQPPPNARQSSLILLPSLFPPLSLSLCPVSYHHPSPPPWRKTKESYRKRDILLASMRKPETGRESEQCQQIREVQKPPQEACQSPSIMRVSETQRKTRELQAVQECHPSQQRVHKQHQIKPWQYVLFYSGNTPVGKAICRVNRALLYRLMYQRAGYMDRPFNFPTFQLCLLFSRKLKHTYNIKRPGGTHLGKNLPQTKQ